VRVPQSWLEHQPFTLWLTPGDDVLTAWVNGAKLEAQPAPGFEGKTVYSIPGDAIRPDDANLIVIRVEDRGGEGGLREMPVFSSNDACLLLPGRWQFRLGEGDASWSNMPLPARFGASPDALFEP
jgi:hypothetical protein